MVKENLYEEFVVDCMGNLGMTFEEANNTTIKEYRYKSAVNKLQEQERERELVELEKMAKGNEITAGGVDREEEQEEVQEDGNLGEYIETLENYAREFKKTATSLEYLVAFYRLSDASKKFTEASKRYEENEDD